MDERSRHELYQHAEATMGRDSADTLMSLLPPVGWADVATKQDLAHLEQRLDARFDAVDARFEALESRFDGLDWQFEALGARIDAGDDRVLAAMRKELNGMVLKMFALVIALVPALVVPLVTLT